MSSGKASGRRTTKDSSDAEVEELLRAAQDDLLLNLSVNSHSISSGSELSSFDSDLARRFQALKTNPSASIPTTTPNPLPNSLITKEETPVDCDDEVGKLLGDDLATRFAKLRGGSGSNAAIGSTHTAKIAYDGTDDEKNEVDKVMQWAMDAARLDPSGHDKLDESEKSGISDEDEEDTDNDDDELGKERGKGIIKEKEKSNQKKWFIF